MYSSNHLSSWNNYLYFCYSQNQFVWLVYPVTEYFSEFDNTLSGAQVLLFTFMVQEQRKAQERCVLVATFIHISIRVCMCMYNVGSLWNIYLLSFKIVPSGKIVPINIVTILQQF